MKTIALFNNKGGVGKTTLVYHLAHMFAERDYKVLAVDLDPQANLSAMCLDPDRIEEVWDGQQTVYAAIQPLLDGTGDIVAPHLELIAPGFWLVVGDMNLSRAEDELSSQWPDCLDRKPRAFRVISSFWRIISKAAEATAADLVLIDVGPNLGAINRAALIAAQHVVIPLSPDLFSLQGLQNLGPALRRWRSEWQERREKAPDQNLSLPSGAIQPIGYVVLQHGVRISRPVQAYQRWINRMPGTYREAVLDQPLGTLPIPSAAQDPYCLAMLKHYRSLMPLAMESHKPMFRLKPADGAIGAHVAAVRDCYDDFLDLARKIGIQIGLSV